MLVPGRNRVKSTECVVPMSTNMRMLNVSTKDAFRKPAQIPYLRDNSKAASYLRYIRAAVSPHRPT
jgi:hypothetical protein